MTQLQEGIKPGIVVLSTSLHLLHINQQATRYLTNLERSASRLNAGHRLAAPLQPFCHDIIENLREQLVLSNLKPFHCYRVIGESGQEILLKGFGLPDRRGLTHSRIVLLLSAHNSVSASNHLPAGSSASLHDA